MNPISRNPKISGSSYKAEFVEKSITRKKDSTIGNAKIVPAKSESLISDEMEKRMLKAIASNVVSDLRRSEEARKRRSKGM